VLNLRRGNACRQVVERRAQIVTGRKPSRDEVDHLIDTGESESIFKKAIMKQGRGHVNHLHHQFAWQAMSLSAQMNWHAGSACPLAMATSKVPVCVKVCQLPCQCFQTDACLTCVMKVWQYVYLLLVKAVTEMQI